MPTYEYACQNGHHFDEFQSIVAAPIEVCPVCGAPAERLISGGTGLIFRGSGFYITDYARKGGGDSRESKILSDKAKSSDSSAPKLSPSKPSSSDSSTGSKD